VVGLTLDPPRPTAILSGILLRGRNEGVIPDYRLAPEHPFRRPRTTCWHVTSTCREGRSSDRSYGRLRWRQSGTGTRVARYRRSASISATLVGVAALSPVTDLTLSGATYETRADADPLFYSPAGRELVHSYLAGADAKHPLASPLHGRLSGMPLPAFMSVTTKCCWTTRSGLLSVQLPQASMPGLMCGWGCHTGFPEASEG